MIVSFYPGGGGNRYIQYILGNNWNDHQVSYDGTNNQQFDHRYLLSNIPAPADITLTHSVNSTQIKQLFPDNSIVCIKTDLQQSLRREWMLHGHKRYVQKTTKIELDRLEHYNNFKDSLWPDVSDISMLDDLPAYIIDEVVNDYNKITSKLITPPVDKIDELKKDYTLQIESSTDIIKWHQEYYKMYPTDFSQVSEIIDVENDNTEFARFMKLELSMYHSEIFDKIWSIVYE